ncbi:PAS/PAC sensor signal transduction histidine kinase [Minicystis rosea]|nr:PAS/PAC sensor signal transduction histidine kinase [Minicystis rosea]
MDDEKETMAGEKSASEITAERLREVVLDLEVAKEHEQQLREEASALLLGLRALTEAKTPEEVFLRLLEALRAPLRFDEAFVLRPIDAERALAVDVSTEPRFVGARFPQGRALTRALDGKVTTFVDTSVVAEWQAAPEHVRAHAQSALCLPLRGESERALVVFTRREPRAFQARHEQLARRFQPLAIQALRDAERAKALHESNRQLAESLARLQQTQGQLVEASRRAGMTDVATTVLHNVGNVLNSVNVSAGIAVDTIKHSRIGGLSKAAEMLRAHRDDLAAFLTTDERGRLLPDYLSGVADAVSGEMATITEELQSLQGNIEHIKMIIAMQQAHARPGEMVETVRLTDIVEEALRINLMSRKGSDMKIVRDFIDEPTAHLDRHKLLQILTNLLSNARHAVKNDDRPDKQITVRIRAESPERVAIEVEDNGCGIAPENLSKIFSFGFTTKKEGHGFGLHSSACSAIEMGGSLAAHSDGPGRGAVFTLLLRRGELP